MRVLEIDQASGERADHLFLVLPEAPQDTWAIEFLDEAFNVSVIWTTDTGWGGTRVDIALGKAA